MSYTVIMVIITRSKPTKAGKFLKHLLENYGKPVFQPFELFALIMVLYQHPADIKLYLRKTHADYDEYRRFKVMLHDMDILRNDQDYGKRALRILTIADCPADEIVCLVDPTCYVSHLSAMQRWGLTNRSPKNLMLTRPDRSTWQVMLRQFRHKILSEQKILNEDLIEMMPIHVLEHPKRVRGQNIQMYSTKSFGMSLTSRGSHMRISTIGQTFLDMLQKPDLCGGMSHVLDVFEEHATTYLDQIISTINQSNRGLVKSRAGYILQEYLGLKHPDIDQWKIFSQRGGSRKLDPSKDFSPTYSETWMVSINV